MQGLRVAPPASHRQQLSQRCSLRSRCWLPAAVAASCSPLLAALSNQSALSRICPSDLGIIVKNALFLSMFEPVLRLVSCAPRTHCLFPCLSKIPRLPILHLPLPCAPLPVLACLSPVLSRVLLLLLLI